MKSRDLHRIRSVALAGLMVSGLLALSGCSAVEISPPIASCKDYRQQSKFGNFGIQQAKRGAAIQWGAYPSANFSGTKYIVSVYTGTKKYDAKTQVYAPHGSIDAVTATKYSGQHLTISGKVQKIGNKGYNDVLVYNMVCEIL